MCPWRQKPDERLALPGGGELALEIRGVPARHRDLWVVLHEPGRDVALVRYLLRRFRETAAVVVVPELVGLLEADGSAGSWDFGPGLAALDAVDDRFGSLSGRLFLAGLGRAGLLAAAWAARHPARVAGLVLVAPDLERWAGVEGTLSRELSSPALLLFGRHGEAWQVGVDFCLGATGPVELVMLPGGGALLSESPEILFERIRAFWRGAAPRPSRPRRIRDASRPKTMRRKRKARGG